MELILPPNPPSNYIPPSGPSDAKIMIIGEAGGEVEAREQVPFCGPTGSVLTQLCRDAGISRDECRIDNVVPFRPPDNNFKYFYKDRPDILEWGKARILAEIQTVNPVVVVLAGNEALKAVAGVDGITVRRGNILELSYGHKAIPIIHPAMILREWSGYAVTKFDFEKIARESGSREIVLDTPLVHTRPTWDWVNIWLTRAGMATKLAVDIEVMNDGIDSIGLSWESGVGVSIPFATDSGNGSYWNEGHEHTIWQSLKYILELPDRTYILQNAMYDMFQLERMCGIRIGGGHTNTIHDTMLMFNLIYPELPKSLDFLASIYLNTNYWGEAPKQLSEERWRYNATDAAVTYMIHEPILTELNERRMEVAI